MTRIKKIKTIKDHYGNICSIGDYIVFNKPGDFVPTIAMIHSFTRTNTPRVKTSIKDPPKALIIKRCYKVSSINTIRSHKLYFIKVNPTDDFKNKIYMR